MIRSRCAARPARPRRTPAGAAGLLLAVAACALPAAAQPAGTAAEEPAAPDAPALAPPAPAQLPPRAPAPAAPPAETRVPVAAALPGLEARGEGGWRLRFPNATAAALSGNAPSSLGELGRRLAVLPTGRVTIIAQASGPANDVSAARRLSLERGIAVKQALAAGGLPETRIDIRPAGRTEEAVDAVDVLPPAPPRPPAR